ncbi:hydrogenase formation protein HypD [Neobacillus sp. Marseille-QA0830]
MLEILKQSSNPELCKPMAEAVIEKAVEFRKKFGRKPVFMEVCGSHTMALARTGVKPLLKDYVELISGPGCPVCVTDQRSIDSMIALAEGENRIICTFGDMMRVPGSDKTLHDSKIAGKDIRVLYSPIEAISIAEANCDKEVIFLGIGFETTIPILTLMVGEAEKRGINNFSIWMATKLLEPVLRNLLDAGDIQMDGFILPGHVSIVLGEESYSFLVDEYEISGVITGFETAELLSGIYKLIELAFAERPEIQNNHPAVVTKTGNQQIQKWLDKYLKKCDEAWRGIGIIKDSGLDLKAEYDQYNAKKRFTVDVNEPHKTKCRCGEVIRGLIAPNGCPLFAKACHPMNPIGPCMVSAEGSCATYYQYMRESF